MIIEVKLTLNVPDAYGDTELDVLKTLANHYEDLGHLAGEMDVVRGTVHAGSYYMTNADFGPT